MPRKVTDMTSISAIDGSALLILRQTGVQPAGKEEEEAKKPDLVKVANGISGEPAKETLKAAFSVSVAFMELDAKGEMAAAAATFIDSDQFRVSDPDVKETLKGLIAENGWQFMQLVKQTQEAHGGLAREDLFAIVLPQMIAKNRDKFTADEIEISVKFEDKQKGGVIVFVPDSEGNSSYRELTKAIGDEELKAASTGDKTALTELRKQYGEFTSSWTKAFDYKQDEMPPLLVDVDDVQDAPWLKGAAIAAKAPGVYGPAQ